jgi:adenylate cyclase
MPELLGELVPCGGGDTIPLLKSKILVGRRSRCDITLRFPNVSSHHCELRLENGYWRIEDLGSSNGIKVNDERCDAKWLHPGDTICIAKHCYEIQYTPRGEAPVEQQEDVFAKTLMEKAGLERSRRPRRRDSDMSVGTPKQTSKPAEPSGDPVEDDAYRWLSED